MIIYKRGNFITLQSKLFECHRCGCIFGANGGEYSTKITRFNTYYRCKCPECGTMLEADKERLDKYGKVLYS